MTAAEDQPFSVRTWWNAKHQNAQQVAANPFFFMLELFVFKWDVIIECVPRVKGAAFVQGSLVGNWSLLGGFWKQEVQKFVDKSSTFTWKNKNLR